MALRTDFRLSRRLVRSMRDSASSARWPSAWLIRSSVGTIGSCGGNSMVEVGITSAAASAASCRFRLSAFFISNSASSRLVSASVRFCWSVATVLCARTTSIGAKLPMSTCFCVSDSVFCANVSDSFCTRTFSY